MFSICHLSLGSVSLPAFSFHLNGVFHIKLINLMIFNRWSKSYLIHIFVIFIVLSTSTTFALILLFFCFCIILLLFIFKVYIFVIDFIASSRTFWPCCTCCRSVFLLHLHFQLVLSQGTRLNISLWSLNASLNSLLQRINPLDNFFVFLIQPLGKLHESKSFFKVFINFMN